MKKSWANVQETPEVIPSLLRLALNDAFTYDKVLIFPVV